MGFDETRRLAEMVTRLEEELDAKKLALGVKRFGTRDVREVMLEGRLFGEKMRDRQKVPPHVAASRVANAFLTQSKRVGKIPQGEIMKVYAEARAGYLGVGSLVTEKGFWADPKEAKRARARAHSR